ncbi:MAG: TatD family hydrolase [Phycisphaerales bacterium]
MIDTHCHLTYKELSCKVEEVVAGAREAGLVAMISVGTSPGDAKAARAFAERFEDVYFTVGVHPLHSAEVGEGELAEIPLISGHEKCVAFGEMGLDYHYDKPERGLQRRYFEAQLGMVREWGGTSGGKPVVIHSRKATDDTLAVLKASGVAMDRVVYHCFTEPPEDCRKVLDAGCWVSFTGIVTYKNAPEVRASAMLVPGDRIMVETDAPYLAPEPHRRVRPNEPKYVVATARFLAELRGEDFEEFEGRADGNAKRFFGLR